MEQKMYTPPGAMIGSREIGKQDGKEAAYHALSFAFDTEEIAFIYHQENGFVHFAGCPSNFFLNENAELTNVKAALSGGDGAYVLQNLGSALLIIKENNSYETIAGTHDEVDAIVANLNVEPIYIDDSAEAARWETLNLSSTHKEVSRNRKLTNLMMVLALSAAALWMGISILNKYAEGKLIKANEISSEILKETLNAIPTEHPADNVFKHLNNMKSISIKTGGWIESYNFDTKSGITYSLQLPQWISLEESRHFKDASVRINHTTGMLNFVKE